MIILSTGRWLRKGDLLTKVFEKSLGKWFTWKETKRKMKSVGRENIGSDQEDFRKSSHETEACWTWEVLRELAQVSLARGLEHEPSCLELVQQMKEPLGQINREGEELLLLDYLDLQVIRLSGGNSPLLQGEYSITMRSWRGWHAIFVREDNLFTCGGNWGNERTAEVG